MIKRSKKRTHKEVIKLILDVLKDENECAFGLLERKVDTNWLTIRNHIDILMLFDAVTKTKNNKIKITPLGLKILKKMN